MKIEAVKSPVPKNMKVIEHSVERGEIKWKTANIKAKLRLVFLFPLAVVIPLILAGLLAHLSGEFNGTTFMVIAIICWVPTFYKLAKSETNKFHLIVTPDVITLDNKHYDRNLWEGFVVSISTELDTGKALPQAEVITIDFIYGGVREETKHSIHHVRSSETVYFLNWFIETITIPNAEQHNPEEGIRKQAF